MTEYILTIKFQEESEPYLLDISGLLYDLELAHDLATLTANKEDYPQYTFGRYFWYRNGRPVKDQHRIRALHIVKQSPLLLEVVIPSLGALWILLKIFEKVSNWELNREKLELEVRKLRREEQEKKDQRMEELSNQVWPEIHTGEPKEIEEKIVNRLSKSKIVPKDIKVKPYDSDKG